MHFSREQLENFAAWQPVVAGYDRHTPLVENFTIHHRIHPLIADITASRQFRSHTFEDGGLSNYFAFFLHFSSDLPDISHLEGYSAIKVSGISVYLSLLAPVGVFGRTSAMIGPRSWSGWGLELADVCNTTEAEGELETTFLSTIAKTPYRLLSREEIMQPLPPGVEPYEYCLCEGPYDKVFHVLFANTD
jgi:hypothetical protein